MYLFLPKKLIEKAIKIFALKCTCLVQIFEFDCERKSSFINQLYKELVFRSRKLLLTRHTVQNRAK
jgi:hypothetical protein